MSKHYRLWVLWTAHIWEHQSSRKDKPNFHSLSKGYFGVMFMLWCMRKGDLGTAYYPRMRRGDGQGHLCHHFVQWQLTGGPAAVCVQAPCTLPLPCSHMHTHQSSSSRAWQETSKGIWGDKLLEAVEELGLVTQLLGWQAQSSSPCYLKLQAGRVLAWFLLL